MSDQKYTIIDGKKVPIIPAKATEVIKNKRTGKIYESKDEFDKDVANLMTDTTQDDFEQSVNITVASLNVFGKND